MIEVRAFVNVCFRNVVPIFPNNDDCVGVRFNQEKLAFLEAVVQRSYPGVLFYAICAFTFFTFGYG
jgi:hypothetical protein